MPHSAEEGERALEQSLTALVEDGVIDLKQTGERFTGHGARRFYSERSSPRSRAWSGSLMDSSSGPRACSTSPT